MTRPAKILEILIVLTAVAGVLPLYPHLEALPRLILPAFALVGVVSQLKGTRIPTFLLTAVSIILFAYYAPKFGHNNVAVPAANLLASFLAIRLAGERTVRASLQTCALSIFCLAASTLFTLGPAFLFILLLLSLLIISTLVIISFHESDITIVLNRLEMRSLVNLIICTTAATIPLMLIFFIILPRTQFPLWNAFAGKTTVKGGVAERVEPGKSDSVEQSGAVAFRAETAPLESDELYWRCVVFNNYTAGAWVRTAPPQRETGIAVTGKKAQQTIFPVPGRLRYLPALDTPLQVRAARSSTSGDLVTTHPTGFSTKLRYEATSVPGGTIIVNNGIDRRHYLKLPSSLPRQLAQAADNIAANGKTDMDRLSMARDFYVSRNLRYSTRNLPTGKDHLDSFLFDSRAGHCEYFASSFALIMRRAGVPARVVGGYYGGIYNKLGGYYVVSDEMAHAWSEIYIEGVGWKRIDPSHWSTGFGEISSNREKSIAKRLSTFADTFMYYWDVTVITYDFGRQLEMARNAGSLLHLDTILKKPGNAAYPYFIAVAAIICAVSLAAVMRTRRKGGLVLKFIRLAGYDRPPAGKGILDIASELGNNDAERFARIYSKALYNDRTVSGTELREMKTLLRRLKRLKPDPNNPPFT